MLIESAVFCRIFQFFEGLMMRAVPWRMAKPVRSCGSTAKLAELLASMDATRPMLVTGPRIYASGLASGALAALEKAGMPCFVFSAVEADPSLETVSAIVSAFIGNGCDSMIALGGGSPMDAAKAALALYVRPGRSAAQLGGVMKVHRKLPPFIAVPTTAGTGSETTFAAVITDRKAMRKFALMDPCLVPMYAVLDPLLTEGLPPAVTADTGMDALVHAVEAYLSVLSNTRETLRLAEEAVVSVFKHLPCAYSSPHDLEARAALLDASFKAGVAFTRTGVGYVHALSHAIGAAYHVAHGRANAIILPYVLEDYGKAAEKKLARLARLAGLCPAQSPDEAAAASFINSVRKLNGSFGIEAKLPCIREEDVPRIVTYAIREANPIYPVPAVYNRARCERVLRAFM